jgi:hypothetical protein
MLDSGAAPSADESGGLPKSLPKNCQAKKKFAVVFGYFSRRRDH